MPTILPDLFEMIIPIYEVKAKFWTPHPSFWSQQHTKLALKLYLYTHKYMNYQTISLQMEEFKFHQKLVRKGWARGLENGAIMGTEEYFLTKILWLFFSSVWQSIKQITTWRFILFFLSSLWSSPFSHKRVVLGITLPPALKYFWRNNGLFSTLKLAEDIKCGKPKYIIYIYIYCSCFWNTKTWCKSAKIFDSQSSWYCIKKCLITSKI